MKLPPRKRFGSAAWAVSEEIRRAGLFNQDGPFLGFDGDSPLRLDGDGPLITFGGAGSGKLRDVLAYNLCGYRSGGRWYAPPRMLVNDPRGELAAISIHHQVRFGKKAYCINPWGLHGLPQHSVNPWALLDPDSATFQADVKLLLGDLIVLPTGNDKYFAARGREWCEALLLSDVLTRAAAGDKTAFSLPRLYEIINAIEDPSAWEDIAEAMLNTPDAFVRRIAAEMDAKRSGAPKEYGAIMGSIFESIAFLSDPQVRRTLENPDFSLDVLCNEDCNVYLIIPAEYLSMLAPMQRAIFGAAMLHKNRRPSAPRVLFLIDEAAQLGNFDALARAYTFGRGMGIRAWSIWQDPGQIEKNFGAPALSSFIGSSVARQFVGVRDLKTAQMVAAMLGQETLEYDDPVKQLNARTAARQAVASVLGGTSPFQAGLEIARQSYISNHRDQQARALVMPEEVLQIPEDRQVLFVSGRNIKPIYARKLPYFSRPEMAGAYLPNPYHGPQDRVRIAGHLFGSVPVIRERVPARFAHLPQYQSGEWAYVKGYKPI